MSKYKSKLQNDDIDYLWDAVLSLKTKEECYKFFEDLCTINEIKAMEQRFHVAKMLKNKNIYTEISHVTGASTATISRVNRCLNYGAGGYSQILDRIGWKEDKK